MLHRSHPSFSIIAEQMRVGVNLDFSRTAHDNVKGRFFSYEDEDEHRSLSCTICALEESNHVVLVVATSLVSVLACVGRE